MNDARERGIHGSVSERIFQEMKRQKEAPMEVGAITNPEYQNIADIITRLIQRRIEALHNNVKSCQQQEQQREQEHSSNLRAN